MDQRHADAYVVPPLASSSLLKYRRRRCESRINWQLCHIACVELKQRPLGVPAPRALGLWPLLQQERLGAAREAHGAQL